MRKTIVILFLAAALSACAAGSGKIDWRAASQVKAGMTQQEVRTLMGEPYKVMTVGTGEQRWVWVHVTAFGGHESAVLTFKDGKLLQSFEVPQAWVK